MSVREEIWQILDAGNDRSRRARLLHFFIFCLIILNVFAVMFESVSSIADRWGHVFGAFEFVSVAVFTVEYLGRAWACTADPRYRRPVLGRLRFMLSPMALIDLAAILPSYLLFLHLDLRVIRALRLVRLARLGKLGRYSEASAILGRVFNACREELVLSYSVLGVLSVICASLLYFAENSAQPDKFSSIPSAMWCAVITITTVGYGDVFPVTFLGRVVGAITALLGILMLTLPIGVFSATFMEEINRRKRAAQKPHSCPHCGKPVE